MGTVAKMLKEVSKYSRCFNLLINDRSSRSGRKREEARLPDEGKSRRLESISSAR